MANTLEPSDPFLWLEDIEGDRALTWVRAQNERSLKQLTADARFDRFYKAALAVLEDKSRIPFGSLRGGWIYNFWQDDVNVRGLWRRAKRESYDTPAPEWQTVLDLDALAKQEDRNWVWKGVSCEVPPGERCMVQLSNGGKDASVYREFDIGKREFVTDGFVLPEAKTDLTWQDRDSLLVATDWGEGTLTASGYPFMVKRWKRGTPLSEAREVHHGKREDVGVSPFSMEGTGGTRFLGISQSETFFTASYHALTPSGVTRMTLPPKATLRGLLGASCCSPSSRSGDWRAQVGHGSLLSMPQSEVPSATPNVRLVLAPGPRDSIEEVAVTRAGVLVARYSNVRGQLERYTFDGRQWVSTRLPLNDSGAVSIVSADVNEDIAYATYTRLPAAHHALHHERRNAEGHAHQGNACEVRRDSKYVTEQFEAKSKDGTACRTSSCARES